MKASLLLSFTISTLRPSLSRISLEGDFFAFFAEPLSDGLCGLSMGDCVLSSCFSVNTEVLLSDVQLSATDASFSGPSLARISLNVVTRFAYTNKYSGSKQKWGLDEHSRLQKGFYTPDTSILPAAAPSSISYG